MKTNGLDVGFKARLINTSNFRWMLGGSVSHARSEIVNLGGNQQFINEFDNGVMVVNKVGEAPNAYYGYKMDKVIYSQEEADNVNLMAHNGMAFSAGDIKYVDQNNDNIIDEKDRVVLGNASPDVFGSLYSSVQYKNVSLFVNFSYEKGQELYNGLRRSTESLSGLYNQSVAAERRWSYDGQVTNIPKASYGDPIDNGRFSSRWIEDGSFVKLKSVTLSYELNRSLGFIQKGQFYVTGENLFTFTDYLGYDPEFSYSYDSRSKGFDLGKAPLPKSFKVGVKLQF